MTDSGLVDLVLVELSSDRRPQFFGRLVQNLSLAARASYPEAGASTEDALTGLTGGIEVFHALGNQMAHDAREGGGPSDTEFIQGVLDRADHYQVGLAIRYALQRSV
jgi:hypothetical protein